MDARHNDGESGQSAWVIFRRALGTFGGANVAGALIVFLYFVVVPAGEGIDGPNAPETVAAFVAFLAGSVALGGIAAWRALTSVTAWAIEGREPASDERRVTLSLPWSFAVAGFRFWALASVVFGVLSAVQGDPARDTVRVVAGILLGGLAASTMTYLLLDRVLRPLFATALAGGHPPETRSVGIRQRLVLSWALGSGVPLLAIAVSPFSEEAGNVDAVDLGVVAVIGFLAGGLMVAVAARSVSDRIEAVRAGLRRVERGDLDTGLAVDDGGDVGQLQAGFNQMVQGLRERQRLRDLFGRHVGDEVATEALERGAQLGGERREISVLFVDVVGSTALASEVEPEALVAMLNDVFAAVVRAVSAERGWVNKFEGDGALCVFGAPGDQTDHAARALGSAVRLRGEIEMLRAKHPYLDAGIGVSSGVAVAGNVGAQERYEYTVVGDPVNEAARLTDEAKGRPGRVLASAATVEAAGADARRWQPGPALRLRGRSGVTRSYEPSDVARAVSS